MINEEQTISNLKKLKSFHNGSYGSDIDKAIKALEQESCDDAISRQAVFEQINCWIGSGEYRYTNATDYLNKRIKALQAVNPQEKTGHWIEHPETEYLMFYECSECGDKQCFCKSDIHRKHFCNNCGARMFEPQESEEV